MSAPLSCHLADIHQLESWLCPAPMRTPILLLCSDQSCYLPTTAHTFYPEDMQDETDGQHSSSKHMPMELGPCGWASLYSHPWHTPHMDQSQCLPQFLHAQPMVCTQVILGALLLCLSFSVADPFLCFPLNHSLNQECTAMSNCVNVWCHRHSLTPPSATSFTNTWPATTQRYVNMEAFYGLYSTLLLFLLNCFSVLHTPSLTG